jgi:hypothetical protein
VVQKYNKNGKEDLCIFYNWKQNSSKWVEEGRNEAQKERKTNSKTSRHWDVGLNKWIDNAKAESQYDAQGREILSVSYKWNAVENRWEQVSKTETAYDENNNPISILFYAWWQENWVLSETRENSYVKRD